MCLFRHVSHGHTQLKATDDGATYSIAGEIAIDHEIYNNGLAGAISGIFGMPRIVEGVSLGGKDRALKLIFREGNFGLVIRNQDSPLNEMIAELGALFRELYATIDFPAMEKRYGTTPLRPELVVRKLPAGTVRPPKCVDDHERIIAIFEKYLEILSRTDQVPEERTQNQFLSLFPDKDMFPIMDSHTFNQLAQASPILFENDADQPPPLKKRKPTPNKNGLFGQDDDIKFFEPSF